MHFRLYSTHVCVANCFSLVAYYYCFLSSITIQLFSLACQPSRSPQRLQNAFLFCPFFYHRRSRSGRTALPPILLFPDWCVRKKNVLYVRCVVVSCCAGIWICWTCRGMIYPCENPKTNNSACERVLPVRLGAPLEAMAVLSTQQAAIVIYCKSISEISWVPYHHPQMPEYHGH